MAEKKARSRAAPPLRLAWPAGGDVAIGQSATLCSSQGSSSSYVKQQQQQQQPRKRGLKRTASFQSISSSSMLWVDKYAPRNDATQLCVAPKKVSEVKSWIEHALNGQGEKLLVLVGSPGVGKSTMVRVLASELVVMEWNDTYSSRQQYSPFQEKDALLSVDHLSALKSFETFLKSAGAGYQSVCVPSKRRKGKPNKHGGSTHDGKSIILLEELPNLYSAEAELQFREIMRRHIQQSQVPTILIFSDVSEGKHKPKDLERLIPAEQLYSNSTRILQCHAVTKAKLKKCLQTIAKKEGITSVPSDFFEEIYLQSGGDVRHAIMALQFQKAGKGRHDKTQQQRDTKLSTFHALGKLLYAKRQKHVDLGEDDSPVVNSNPLLEKRAPLEFNPELVMEQSDMGLVGSLTFLGYHSTEFFTDTTDLSQAFGHFSDAAVFSDQSMDLKKDQGDKIYPGGYVSCLAGRAVANANRHPAPNKFRSFSAPKVFEVMRKRQENQVKMKQLCKRLSIGGSMHMSLGSTRSLVTHDLPFMRTILPHEVSTAVNNLYSHVRQSQETGDLSDGTDRAMKIAAQEQQQILALDDIVDDSSDDETKNDFLTRQSEKMPSTSPTSTVHEPASSMEVAKPTESTTTTERDVIVIDD